MANLTITNRVRALVISIDNIDLERVMERSWRLRIRGSRISIITSLRTAEGSRNVTLERFIYGHDRQVDFVKLKNTSSFDYRRSNLIGTDIATRQQTIGKKTGRFTSRFKGVSFDKAAKAWRAQIEVEKRSCYIGTFKSEILAATAYNEAAMREYGEHAYLNDLSPPSKQTLKRAHSSTDT